MSGLQSFLKAIFPKRWGENMEAESRAWMMRCGNCGHDRSVWEMGGIRWRAGGNPRRMLACPKCGRMSWHTVTRRSSTADGPPK
jgi:hypothetical protein